MFGLDPRFLSPSPVASPRPFRGVQRTVSLVLALAMTAGPSRAQEFVLSPGRAAQRQRCFAQQDGILRAVRGYELDFNTQVTSIPWDGLVRGGYLDSLPIDPGQGVGAGGEPQGGSHSNYLLTGDSGTGLWCSVHGPATGSGPGAPPAAPASDPMVLERCRAQQMMILGAMTLLNLEADANYTSIVWSQLRDRGYLSRIPEDPGEGAHSHMNYALARPQDGGITCMRHGALLRSATPGSVQGGTAPAVPASPSGRTALPEPEPEMGFLGN